MIFASNITALWVIHRGTLDAIGDPVSIAVSDTNAAQPITHRICRPLQTRCVIAVGYINKPGVTGGQMVSAAFLHPGSNKFRVSDITMGNYQEAYQYSDFSVVATVAITLEFAFESLRSVDLEVRAREVKEDDVAGRAEEPRPAVAKVVEQLVLV